MAPNSEDVEVELEEGEEAAPQRGKMAILAVALFLAGAGAGFGASFFLPGDDQAEDEAGVEELAEGDGEETEAAVPDGIIVSLGDFIVNLRGGGGGRLLNMEIQVEGSQASMALMEERKSQIRDALLTIVSDYSFAEVEGVNGKMRLRDDCLARINGIMRPQRIERIYFTRFVVQ